MRTVLTVSFAAIGLAACSRPSASSSAPAVAPRAVGPALLELDEGTLSRIEADGRVLALYTLGATSHAEGNVSIIDWQIAGRFIALAAMIHTEPPVYEYAVLDAHGTVLFARVQPEPWNPSIHLAADGTLAVSGREGFVVSPGGAVTTLGDHHPLAPVVRGHVLCSQGHPHQQGGATHGWLSLATRELRPIWPTPLASDDYWLMRGRLVFVGPEGQLMTTTPEATEIIPLEPRGALSFAATTRDERHALFQLHPGPGYVLLSIPPDTEAIEAHFVRAPLDQGRDAGRVSLADDGAVLRPFRLEDGRLQLRATKSLGEEWTDVGEPMRSRTDFGPPSELVSEGRGGRVLVLDAARGFGNFLDEVQLVTPGAPSVKVAGGGAFALEGDLPDLADLAWDGSLAATWSQRGGTDRSAELELLLVHPDGSTRVIRSSTRASRLRFAPPDAAP